MAGRHIQRFEPRCGVNRHLVFKGSFAECLERDALTKPLECFSTLRDNPPEPEPADQQIQGDPELNRRASVVPHPLPCPFGCNATDLQLGARDRLGCAHFGDWYGRRRRQEHAQTLAGVANP